MNRKRQALAIGALLAAGAGALRARARHDREAIDADPAWPELNRSLAPETATVRRGTDEALVVDSYGDEDAPIVVLVHGWVCTARFWTRQIQALREDHRLVAYDARGHGRSGSPRSRDYSIEALADDLELVLQSYVPAGRPFVLAGHSLGAMTIVAWAARHPETARRAGAAALINTGIADLVAEARVAPLPPRLAALQQTLGRAFLSAPGRAPSPGPLSHRAVRHVALSRQASPAEVAFCERMILECEAPARAGCGRTLHGLDLRAALESLQAPTVVVTSERDRLTPRSHGIRLARDLPCAVGVVELAGCGHMGPIEAAARVSEVIRGMAAGYARKPEPAVAA